MKLISREEAIKVFGEIHPCDYNAIAYKSKIEKLPIIESRPKGKWRDGIDDWTICSNCGYGYARRGIGLYKYCPKCGSDMRQGEK